MLADAGDGPGRPFQDEGGQSAALQGQRSRAPAHAAAEHRDVATEREGLGQFGRCGMDGERPSSRMPTVWPWAFVLGQSTPSLVAL